MGRAGPEVADVFRRYGASWRDRHGASMWTAQRAAMSAIELCRTAALGGHVEQCDQCGEQRICYNSCRSRNCPKCQSLARAEWIEHRRAELLDAPYFHVVFTMPNEIAAIAFQNADVVYNILFRATADTLRTIAADPKHLGAEIGFFAILHTWGQNLSHHPHIHCAIPGGGISPDGERWISCRPRFFLPVRVLGRLFRRLFLEALEKAFRTGKLKFVSSLQHLCEAGAFNRYLGSVRRINWIVYSKPPFGGPERVLDYLGRYTHRIAISNNRLIDIEDGKVRFSWKDYRNGNQRKVMTLDADEFIRRFLIHVLPPGFQRIRYYGFLGNRYRKEKLARCRQLLGMQQKPADQAALYAGVDGSEAEELAGSARRICPACHLGHMIYIEVLERIPPSPQRRLDTS